jgi:hypothetical protein
VGWSANPPEKFLKAIGVPDLRGPTFDAVIRFPPLSPLQPRHLRPIAASPQPSHSGHIMLSKAMPLFCFESIHSLVEGKALFQ